MRNLLLASISLFVLLFSCGELSEDKIALPTAKDISSCKVAKDYIFSCVGFRPHLENCNERNTQDILATPCNEVPNLWR
jgi:hypothetical protein